MSKLIDTYSTVLNSEGKLSCLVTLQAVASRLPEELCCCGIPLGYWQITAGNESWEMKIEGL